VGGLLSHPFKTPDGSKRVNMSLGCFYRFSDALIPTFKLDYQQYSLGMSYDVAMSNKRIHMSGFGGYELSLSIRGNYNHKKTPSYTCPQFELLDIDSDDIMDTINRP
jgi:hypothetical protein